jgi:hypothetical protein
VSISNPTHRHANNENEGGVVYATFVSEYDFLSHSVICAFNIEDIDRLFAISPYYTKEKNRNVYLRKRRVRNFSYGRVVSVIGFVLIGLGFESRVKFKVVQIS